jgi:N6-adenosine-specific RNA methylase IME4
MEGWPFGDLRPFSYEFIMADPPWSFDNWSAAGEVKNAKAQYSCMDLEAIQKLPVGHLAAPDCCMFLWATWPLLPEALTVMTAWGFPYVTGGAWHKKTVGGKTAFGTGYRVRCASEPFLLGFIGNPKNSRGERNLIEGVVREHSRKPEAAFAWAERYLPFARRLELFSRTNREGWDCWGDEIGKFNEEVTA